MSEARAYRIDELPTDHPMAGIERRRVIGDRMMISEIRLSEGTFVPTHVHENEQFVLVVAGHLRLTIDDGDRVIDARPGEIVHVPSNVPHAAEAIEETVALDLFSPTSEATGVDQFGADG